MMMMLCVDVGGGSIVCNANDEKLKRAYDIKSCTDRVRVLAHDINIESSREKPLFTLLFYCSKLMCCEYMYAIAYIHAMASSVKIIPCARLINIQTGRVMI